MILDNNDIANIEAAINADGKIWENELLSEFKSKFKTYYRTLKEEQCCYCKKNSHGEFNMVLDIEHVLPKSAFKKYMFTISNLSISCKRCNMKIKKEDHSFITDLDAVLINHEDKDLYKIVHPNLDNYFLHIKYFSQIIDDTKIIKYTIVPDSKGQFTYDYFKLSELEVDSINKAQGVKKRDEISPLIDPLIAKKIEDLLDK